MRIFFLRGEPRRAHEEGDNERHPPYEFLSGEKYPLVLCLCYTTTDPGPQGNILGPLTFRNEDAPQYIPAKLSIVVVDSVAIGTAVLLLLYYRWQNKTRDAAAVEHTRDVEFADLTDRENKEFRYKY